MTIHPRDEENHSPASQGCASAHRVRLRRGNIYWLCRCGLSTRVPFCDGSHNALSKDQQCLPEVVQASGSGEFLWCGCGKSRRLPECDGCSDQNKENYRG